MKWIMMTLPLTAAVLMNGCNKNGDALKARPTLAAKSAGTAKDGKVEGAFFSPPDSTNFNLLVPSSKVANLLIAGDQPYVMDVLCTNTIVSALPAEKAPRLRIQGGSQVIARESQIEPIPGQEGETPKPLMNLICKTRAAAPKPGIAPKAPTTKPSKSVSKTATPPAPATPAASASPTTAPEPALPANVQKVEIKAGEGAQVNGLFGKDQTDPVQVNISCVESKALAEASKTLLVTDGTAPDLVMSVGSKILVMTALKKDEVSEFALISCGANGKTASAVNALTEGGPDDSSNGAPKGADNP